MSRTFRKKYIPALSREELSDAEFSRHYGKFGVSPDGLRWYTTNWRHKAGNDVLRVIKSIGRDGNKPHANGKMIINNAIKKIDSKVRIKLNHELRRMRSGNIEWDEAYENNNKIRMVERGYRFYDIF